MNTRIYLVRHGETKWNALGKFQGCTDIDLSPEGKNQATFLQKRFNNKFDAIYSSPLNRALETAQVISGDEAPLVICNDLREINFGKWEGLTVKEIKSNFSAEFNNWKTDEEIAPICGGDLSVKNASIRAKNALTSIASENINKDIIVVSHGGFIKAALIGLFDWKMTMYHKIIIGNTSICELVFDKDLNPGIVSLNDTSHLPDNNYIKSFL